jgi:hypothetical protein
METEQDDQKQKGLEIEKKRGEQKKEKEESKMRIGRHGEG